MIGLDASTGGRLQGVDHLRQSIRDILTTPVGSRVMRRDYGSRLPRLIDAPINDSTLLDLYAATVEALITWEPRIEVESVSATSAAPGRVSLTLSGRYTPDGSDVVIEDLEIAA